MKYSILIQYFIDDDEEYFVATVPELPGCMGDGETYEEALESIQISIELWLEACREMKREIPKPNYYLEG